MRIIYLCTHEITISWRLQGCYLLGWYNLGEISWLRNGKFSNFNVWSKYSYTSTNASPLPYTNGIGHRHLGRILKWVIGPLITEQEFTLKIPSHRLSWHPLRFYFRQLHVARVCQEPKKKMSFWPRAHHPNTSPLSTSSYWTSHDQHFRARYYHC